MQTSVLAGRAMYGGGREKKTKVTKRSQQAAQAAAAEAAADGLVQQPSSSKRDKWLKQKHRHEGDEDPHGPLTRRGSSWQPPQGEVDGSLGENVFMRWEELLGSREALKRRLDTIAAVHGWQARSSRKTFLGGIEPGALVRSLRAEVQALDQAATELERADLLLQLQQVRKQLEALGEEREHLAEDVAQLQEDNFEARALLAGQSEELDRLRQQAVEGGGGGDGGGGGGSATGGGSGPGSGGGGGAGHLPVASSASSSGSATDMAIFQSTLSAEQADEGRRVVEAPELAESALHPV